MRFVCDDSEPTPIAYLDVYDKGDEWVKVQGCEACPLENRIKCCGNCPMLVRDKGECRLHYEGNNVGKPFACIKNPTPDTSISWCALEFKCIKGKHEGKIRRVKDKGDTFVA